MNGDFEDETDDLYEDAYSDDQNDFPDPDDSDTQPDEEDYVIGDDRGKYGVAKHMHGHVGSYGTLEEAYQAVKDDAGEAWRPNVWSLSDHGNHHLVENFPWDVTIELG